ncbi:MAG TPA: MarR family transcriptional regulator [Acidimicrobiales bacterium]|jgi:MarR family transcriptional regulator, organic hydroperoxide resistance regulator|nr:MarR family transcriptional regulator [Acidimicrobiales bacterium]
MSRRIASSEATVVSQAERDIRARLDEHDLDFTAMSAVSNIYRAGSAIRNHMERELLAEYDLSWVAFTVLWVLWIWGEQETGLVAAEAGITKGTLTGVMKTLQARRLIRRIPHRDDRRRVSIGLSKPGERLIERLFPEFNRHETLAVSSLSDADQLELARLLRLVLKTISDTDELG